ncbi:hypothetical protein FHR84_003916 [Actinopolyspora biskrensis]|uniref:DUF3558 domain-containing protein n=1 Tax=Actinopolyspora biskrensis TaxID=1470178 RepID=A0A852Z301_9ACTN|nr:DUF3558 family protein [Actinopolyspora biskrensis]NYH80550.1 hypothetical protein [Actinopolyspora biskrensis]
MRKTVTTGISLFAGLLLLAGCGGQTDQSAQDTTNTETISSTNTNSTSEADFPKRTAPAKSITMEDHCSIITEQKASKLGVDQPPEESSSKGRTGCHYRKGEPGTRSGWAVFVGLDPDTTTKKFASKRSGDIQSIDGYPVFQTKKPYGCVISADLSDKGSLFVNGAGRDLTNKANNPHCKFFSKFAKSAIENLPNA